MADIERSRSGAALTDQIWKTLPGIGLCILVTVGAYLLNYAEQWLMGRNWLGSVVIAIVLGMAVRGLLRPNPAFASGIAFCAKSMLEVGVCLMGATISANALRSVDVSLVIGIAIIVVLTCMLGVAFGRMLGLSSRLAILIGCGNSICGNSAVIAVAPLIRATSSEVAVAIAFTAVLGVLVILCLPLVGLAIGLNDVAYGTLAGLVVYAVPQVVAAAAPVSALALQVGILVKLVRVLMLAPMCLAIALIAPLLGGASTYGSTADRSPRLYSLPWFIIGFVVLLAMRSYHMLPERLTPTIAEASGVFTLVAMAALGLSVHVRDVMYAGWRVLMAGCCSLVGLIIMSAALIVWLKLV